jgi:hypothetical protein
MPLDILQRDLLQQNALQQNALQQKNDLKCLDELIATLGGADNGMHSQGPCALPVEHLEAARRNLLGASVGEYRFSLEQAKESVVCVIDKNARNEIKKLLRSLIDANGPKPHGAAPATTGRIPSSDQAPSKRRDKL